MHLHHRWAQATTALQVAIAMPLSTRRKLLEWAMFGMAGIGLVLSLVALLNL